MLFRSLRQRGEPSRPGVGTVKTTAGDFRHPRPAPLFLSSNCGPSGTPCFSHRENCRKAGGRSTANGSAASDSKSDWYRVPQKSQVFDRVRLGHKMTRIGWPAAMFHARCHKGAVLSKNTAFKRGAHVRMACVFNVHGHSCAKFNRRQSARAAALP